MKLVPHAGNLAYYTSIMLNVFHVYCAQHYAGTMGKSVGIKCMLISAQSVLVLATFRHLAN